MTYTRHAATRAQQRGIPPLVVDLLWQFGTREHDPHGAEIIYFDRRARKRIEQYTGGTVGKLHEHLNTYAVIAGGQVITLGTRHKRINHS